MVGNTANDAGGVVGDTTAGCCRWWWSAASEVITRKEGISRSLIYRLVLYIRGRGGGFASWLIHA